MTSPSPVERVLERLESKGRSGDEWEASCPVVENHKHGDRKPSLTIGEGGNGCAVVCCQKGCPTKDVLAAIGLSFRDLYAQDNGDEWTPRGPATASYVYTDEEGRVLFGVARTADKQFPQWRPDPTSKSGRRWKLGNVRKVLYHLPDVRRCAGAGGRLYIVEGEKDVERLRSLGLTTTCSPGGAKKWRGEYADQVAGVGELVILPDNDDEGRSHAAMVAGSVSKVVPKVKVVELPGLPDKGDVSDWLDHGKIVDELVRLVDQIPEWTDRRGTERPFSEGDHEGAHTENMITFANHDHLRGEDDHRESGVFLRSLADIRPQAVQWLWDDFLPLNSLSLIVGNPGVNKSTLTIELAAELSLGKLPGDLYGLPSDTIIATAEDSDSFTVAPRAVAAGADRTRIHTAYFRRDDVEGHLILPENLQELEARVREVKARLLVIDPLTAHLGEKIDSYRDQDIRRALAPLARLADDTNSSVVALIHTNKTQTTNFFDKTGGSIGITAAARSALLVARDPEQPERSPDRVVVHAKCNVGPEAGAIKFRLDKRSFEGEEGEPIDTIGITWTGDSDVGVGQALSNQGEEERSAQEEAVEVLRDILADGPVWAREVHRQADEAGVSKITLRRAQKALGISPRKVGAPGERGQKWVWDLPPTKVINPPEDDHHLPKVIINRDDHLRNQGTPTTDPGWKKVAPLAYQKTVSE